MFTTEFGQTKPVGVIAEAAEGEAGSEAADGEKPAVDGEAKDGEDKKAAEEKK